MTFRDRTYGPRSLASGAFTPRKIGGCNWWLRADLGITLNGGNVSAWADQSKLGDSNRNALQGTALNQPLYVSSNAGYNNKPTINFTSAQNLITGNFSSSISAPWTIFVVANFGSSAVIREAIGSNLAGTQIEIRSEVTTFASTTNSLGGISTTTAVTGGPACVVTAYRTTAPLLGVTVNDNTVGTTTAAVPDETINGFTVGNATSTGAVLNGDIAEVIMYNRSLTRPEKGTIVGYLGARYGIAVVLS